MNYTHTHTNSWLARPLNRTGNLSAWQQKMKARCPNPTLGEIVYLDKFYTDKFTGDKTSVTIGYKVIGFNRYGDAVWQRGQQIVH